MIPFYGWGRINPKKWTKGSYTRKKLSFKLKLLSMFLNQAIVFWHCDRYCGSLIVYSMTICVLGKSKSEVRQAINQNRSTYTVFFLCLLHAQLNSSPSQSSKLSDGGRANCYVRFLHNYLKHKQTIEKGENLFKKYFTKLFFFSFVTPFLNCIALAISGGKCYKLQVIFASVQ